jgi:hypothetical protein
MHLVLADAEIPDDVGVGIEYQIPQTAKQLSDPSGHPALRIAGILDLSRSGTADAAREHDRLLADAEEDSWSGNELG